MLSSLPFVSSWVEMLNVDFSALTRSGQAPGTEATERRKQPILPERSLPPRSEPSVTGCLANNKTPPWVFHKF